MLTSIAKSVGANVTDDPEAEVLEQTTRPENLVEQIETAMEESEKAAPKGH